LYVLATPTEGDRINLSLGVSAKKLADAPQANPLLRALPASILAPIVARTTLDGLVHDVEQDRVIWENKKYIERPALAEGDGPIGKYRQWSRQFYHTDVQRVVPAELSSTVEINVPAK
jgi:hypothetical protein